MIDWGRVAELRDEIGEEDFHEVVELFLEEFDEVVERLEQSPDTAELEADLHFLKGSALNLGFRGLGRLCGEGEKRAAAGEADAVDIGAVIDEYRAARHHFLVHLAAGTAA